MTTIKLLVAVIAWFPMCFTAPGAVTYRAYMIAADGTRAEVPMRSSPSTSAPPISPSPRGWDEYFYLAVDDAEVYWRRGGTALRVYAYQGDSIYVTNTVLVAAGVPADTIMRDVAGGEHREPKGWRSDEGNGWAEGWAITYPCYNDPARWCVSIERVDPADSAMVTTSGPMPGRGPIVHQEDWQLARRPSICQSSHVWARRGQNEPCP